MSTLKTINIQHPSAANPNLTLDQNGIASDIELTTVPFFGSVPFINANFTVSNTYNYMTPGPVSVANGVTVTVSNNAFWTVV